MSYVILIFHTTKYFLYLVCSRLHENSRYANENRLFYIFFRLST